MSSTESRHVAVLADIAATHTAVQRAEARRAEKRAAAEAKTITVCCIKYVFTLVALRTSPVENSLYPAPAIFSPC